MFINQTLPISSLKWLLLLFLLSFNSAKSQNNDLGTRQLLQLAEYIGVDYSEAVSNGEVINAEEYDEMQEFSGLLLNHKYELPESFSLQFKHLSQSLKSAIDTKQSTEAVRKITTQLITLLLSQSPELSLPNKLLSTVETAQLFQKHCSTCHGVSGEGDGLIASELTPAPTDFTDYERAVNRSLMGMYDAISEGIEGTAMSSFNQLNEQQRWSLTLFVGGIAFESSESLEPTKLNITIKDFVSQTPSNLTNVYQNENSRHINWLRLNPQVFFEKTDTPIAIARRHLNEALIAYNNGDLELAQSHTIAAYLDGFEQVENTLDARDSSLRKSIEIGMLALRQSAAQSDNAEQFTANLQEVLNQLELAEGVLSANVLTNSTLFSASFIILVREGLEAILVVLALLTVLMRTDRHDAIRFVHLGWVTALLAGIATWWLAQYVIQISGANREIMEGVAALLAAVVLFYVGFWMHNKTQAKQWQMYINQHVKRHLSQGTLWGITGLTFIAVYREVFETVLFYQSLLTQSHPEQYLSIGGGFFFGVVLLVGIAWLMIRLSVKMPLSQFFAFTTYLMLMLSFILAGKAVAALQEAALIKHSPLPIKFSFEWLGIYSTWEGVFLQSIILLLSIMLVVRIIRLKKAVA